MNEVSLKERLAAHDWTWEYSDQFLRHACNNEKNLKRELQEKRCPYTWEQLQYFCYNWVEDELVPYTNKHGESGWMSQQSVKYDSMYPIQKSQILTRKQYQDIDMWLFLNAR